MLPLRSSWTDVGQGWEGCGLGSLCVQGDACDAARRGRCGRPALHALVSDLWTKDDGTRNSRAAQDGPVHFQSLNAGVSMRRAAWSPHQVCVIIVTNVNNNREQIGKCCHTRSIIFKVK